MTKISCIIPAFNEGPRILAVLKAAEAVLEIDEIIVVDDGSTDDTVLQVESFVSPRVHLITQARNGGKAAAVAKGIAHSKGSIVLLLDADLTGITSADISALIAPVLSGESDVSLSLRSNVPFFYKWLGLDPLTGERCFPRELLAGHEEKISTLRSFSLEVYLNRLFLAHATHIRVVRWRTVSSPYKYWKSGFVAGLLGDVGMLRDILKIVSVREFILQVRGLRAITTQNSSHLAS